MENDIQLKQTLRRGLDDFVLKVIIMAAIMKNDTPQPDKIDECVNLVTEGLSRIDRDSTEFSTFACAFRTMLALCEQVIGAMTAYTNRLMRENQILKQKLAEIQSKHSDIDFGNLTNIDPVAAQSFFDDLMSKLKG